MGVDETSLLKSGRRRVSVRAMLVILGVAILLGACMIVVSSRHGPVRTFTVRDLYQRTASVESALALACMTERFVIPEGGYYGGVLKPEEPVDIRAIVPTIDHYSPAHERIIWLYRFRPTRIDRDVDLFGDRMRIHAVHGHVDSLYFAVVPSGVAGGIKDAECVED